VDSSYSNSDQQLGCTVGFAQWQEIVNKNLQIISAFERSAVIHFLSCVVGLGNRGHQFTLEIAKVLNLNQGMVQAAMKYGLGDWSMLKVWAFGIM